MLSHGSSHRSATSRSRCRRAARPPASSLRISVLPRRLIRCATARRANTADCLIRSDRVTQIAIAAAAAVSLVLGASRAYASDDAAAAAPPDELTSETELFDPRRYAGRWYEVASLKRGFAGEGQQDCHCTQGVYTMREDVKSLGLHLEVSTFCVHGGPQGKISGITGAVTCADPFDLRLLPEFETPFERAEQIAEKCVLRFPAIPFIPPETYDIIRTDYTTYALVQGAKDASFVQIYSRTPNPGDEFLEQHKATLATLGYPVEDIRVTPQECPVVPMDSLQAAMAQGAPMELIMSNTMPATVSVRDLLPAEALTAGPAAPPAAPDVEAAPPKGLAFGGQRSLLESVKDLAQLFQQ